MQLAPFYLALSLLLLLLPTALFLGRRRRHSLRSSAQNELVTLPTLLTCVWSWVDLARAAGGGWLLTNKVVLPPTTVLQIWEVVLGLVIQLGPLLLGAWLQIMLTGSRRLRLAPLFYLLGLTVAVLPWQVWLFGGLLGMTLTGMLRRWRAVFWIMPCSLLGAAVLFRSISFATLLVPVLYLLTSLLGIRPDRPLAWVTAPPKEFSVRQERRRHERRSRRSVSVTTSPSPPPPGPPPETPGRAP